MSYDGKHNEANGENNQDGPDYNYSWNCGAEGATRRKSVFRTRKKTDAECVLSTFDGAGDTMHACRR